jgi:hypothetical protein
MEIQMPKYKNNTPQIVEGFLEKMFGALATNTGKKVAAKMSKKDPEMGKLLNRAQGLMKQAEKRLKGMSAAEKEKHFADLEKELGI